MIKLTCMKCLIKQTLDHFVVVKHTKTKVPIRSYVCDSCLRTRKRAKHANI